MEEKIEPLKDIEKQCHDFLNYKKGCEMPGYPKEKFTGFYIEKENVREMIKSAVDWLIDIMKQEGEPSNIVGSTRKNIDLEIAIINVKKAFEEVTKDD